MKRTILGNQSGLTIIEVLISAVVFMIGFSLLIALLNTTLVRLSTKETELANRLAEERMLLAIEHQETENLDTTITRSGLRFAVHREIQSEGNIAAVSIAIARQNRDKTIIELYNEVRTSKKQ